jgi:hypothetical protein
MIKRIAFIVPYVAVALGLFVFHSAWFALVGYHVGMVAFLYFGKADVDPRLFLPRNNILLIVGMIVFGLIGGIGLGIMWDRFGVSDQAGMILSAWGLNSVSWIPFIVYFALVNPWLEEIYWRGWLGDDQKHPVLNDFLFAGYHLMIVGLFVNIGWTLFAFFALIVAAWAWRQIARMDRSLFAPSLSHLAADASILIVAYLWVR